MRVLVTGGAGYIGSHTACVLASAGFEPVVLDDLSSGHRYNVRWGPLVECNAGDSHAVRRALLEYRPVGVIHFAAHAYVGESMDNPRKYFQNNVVNSLSLLDALVDAGIRPIIFSSSCATYGLPTMLPIVEEQQQLPVNPYGESKLFVERALRWYGKAYGLQWVALRYFNAAGGDPFNGLREVHDPETHLIPLIIEAAQGKRSHIEIFGTDYETPDGTAIRDYIHVLDLADAHVAALSYLLEGGQSVALNLGTGCGHSVREAVQAIAKATGRDVPVREGPRRPGDPPALIADPTRAERILGWRPRRSALDVIAHDAWQAISGRSFP